MFWDLLATSEREGIPSCQTMALGALECRGRGVPSWGSAPPGGPAELDGEQGWWLPPRSAQTFQGSLMGFTPSTINLLTPHG